MAREKLSSKTSIRFSLRFIFLVITLAGIICAAIAPEIRSWPQAKQTTVLLILAALLLATLVIPFLFVFVRNRIEKIAGEPLARFVGKQHTAHRALFFFIGCVCFALASLVIWVTIFFVNWNTGIMIAHLLYIFYFHGLASLGIIFFCLSWWGGYTLEIRSEGIIHDSLSFKPWKSIKSFCWTGSFYWKGERLKLTKERGAIVFSAQAADKPLIDQCLKKYLPVENNDK